MPSKLVISGKCMSALNKKISKTELKFLITCSDKDENGKMDCYEFSLMASVLVSALF